MYYQVSTMFSYELLSDGEYHMVEMLAVKKKFTLRVDGGLARSIVNEGENESIHRADRQALFVSGVPADVGKKVSTRGIFATLQVSVYVYYN